jgi:hypothetical protein
MGRRDDGEVTKLPPALRKLRRWDNSHEHWNTQPGTTGRCAILPPLAGKRTRGAVWPSTEDANRCGSFDVESEPEKEEF